MIQPIKPGDVVRLKKDSLPDQVLEDTHVAAAADMLKDYLLEKGRIEP